MNLQRAVGIFVLSITLLVSRAGTASGQSTRTMANGEITMALYQLKMVNGAEYYLNATGQPVVLPGSGVDPAAGVIAIFAGPNDNDWYIDRNGLPVAVPPPVATSSSKQHRIGTGAAAFTGVAAGAAAASYYNNKNYAGIPYGVPIYSAGNKQYYVSNNQNVYIQANANNKAFVNQFNQQRTVPPVASKPTGGRFGKTGDASVSRSEHTETGNGDKSDRRGGDNSDGPASIGLGQDHKRGEGKSGRQERGQGKTESVKVDGGAGDRGGGSAGGSGRTGRDKSDGGLESSGSGRGGPAGLSGGSGSRKGDHSRGATGGGGDESRRGDNSRGAIGGGGDESRKGNHSRGATGGGGDESQKGDHSRGAAGGGGDASSGAGRGGGHRR